MLSLVRAGLAAALLALALVPAAAADKAFQRSDLDAAAIKLEAQIKQDAGSVTKPVAALRQQADAAFQKRDFRTGMLVLGQMVTVAPNDAASWLRLARTIRQIRPRDDREKALLLDRASTAAYIAYQRAQDRTIEGRQPGGARPHARRPPALAARARRSAAGAATCARSPTCAANTSACGSSTASGCSTIRSMPMRPAPRACFQFSESLPGRGTDFSPFVAVAGQDKPAISSTDKQLCVEGLKHGERYQITLRAGLPSTVHETLAKSAEYTIFVRDRKPFVRFSGKAYVLPRTGQRGIPVLSVNTGAVKLNVYRIGDRNLIDTVLGYDFQRNISDYQADAIASRARRQSVERRARRRAEAQHRGHHRVSGRQGARRAGRRRLCHDRRAEGSGLGR